MEQSEGTLNILIIGAVSSSNLGDPLLCRCAEALIRAAYPAAETELLDISGTGSASEIPRTAARIEISRRKRCLKNA